MFKNKLDRHLRENWGLKIRFFKTFSPSSHHGQWLLVAAAKYWLHVMHDCTHLCFSSQFQLQAFFADPSFCILTT